MPKTATAPNSEYNGPDKALFLDVLADYEEHRFSMMRAASLAGKVLNDWESKGGHKDDIRDGYAYRQMLPEEQRAEVRRRHRVEQWMGIVAQDADGQGTFEKLFELTPDIAMGIGGAPLGSRLSIGRAKTAGFNDGKSRNGPSLQEGIELYGFVADSDEALAYAEGFGDGLKLRPPPKAKSKDEDEADEPKTSALTVMTEKLKAMDAATAQASGDDAPKRRGRKPKTAEVVSIRGNPVQVDDEETPGPLH